MVLFPFEMFFVKFNDTTCAENVTYKYSVTALDIMVCDYVHNHVRSMLDCQYTACIDTHTIRLLLVK